MRWDFWCWDAWELQEAFSLSCERARASETSVFVQPARVLKRLGIRALRPAARPEAFEVERHWLRLPTVECCPARQGQMDRWRAANRQHGRWIGRYLRYCAHMKRHEGWLGAFLAVVLLGEECALFSDADAGQRVPPSCM